VVEEEGENPRKDEECRKTAIILLGVICWGWEGGGRGVGKVRWSEGSELRQRG